MAGELQPLDQKFPIVDERGQPTPYFIKWAQQRQIDIGGSITLADLQAYLTAHKLIAGIGIQLTPDGDINDDVTIHADVQAILDEITATRGAILYRGLLGWAALLPDAAGKVLQTNGAGADPSWAAASGGGGDFAKIASITATGVETSFDFTAIPATYKHLVLMGNARLSGGVSDGLLCKVNNLATAIYHTAGIFMNGGALSGVDFPSSAGILIGNVSGTNSDANSLSSYKTTFENYLSTTFNKNCIGESRYNGGSTQHALFNIAGTISTLAAINQLTIQAQSGAIAFAAGSTFDLYGMK